MRVVRWLAILGLIAVIEPREAAAGGTAPLDPAAVPWTRLEFSATKLGAAATVVLELRSVPRDEARREWLACVGGTPIEPPGPTVLLLESRADFGGRHFDDRVWLDPGTGAVTQIEDTERGPHNHRKVYRLMREGFTLAEWEPDGAAEAALDPVDWTKSRRGFQPFPAGPALAPPLTGPAGVLYAVAAGGPPTRTAALATVLVHGQLEAVTVRSGGPAAVETDYVAVAGADESRVTGLMGVERLLVTSARVAPARRLFRVLGLEGDIEMLWDPRRRVPVRVSGEVGLLGRIELRLTRVRMR